MRLFHAGVVVLANLALAAVAPGGLAGEPKVPLVFHGGYETDPRDRGRPVALVAGALGVSPAVFREAFRGVRPAPAGARPTPGQARRNKGVLLAALAPLGVTNDRLDRVSDYYRYNPGRGERWPVSPAAGYAVVKDGTVTSVVITRPGSGYNAPPRVVLPGHPELELRARLAFVPDLKTNGSIASVSPVEPAGD